MSIIKSDPKPCSLFKKGFYYLCGPTGIGKTTLLRNIHIELSLYRGFKVCRLGVEDLVSDLLRSIRKGNTDSFYGFYCDFDVLLIDDIWVLRRKPKTSEAVFHLIERMRERDKMVVLTGDVPVKGLSQGSAHIKKVLRHLQRLKMPLKESSTHSVGAGMEQFVGCLEPNGPKTL
ncbi:MAG: DnaA/Hda family protein [Pseudomonadota bacterium]|jgi:chromosomal replication initiation ATPase DnaA|nr:ATP-binding protein [Pseudomonadota bacterium]